MDVVTEMVSMVKTNTKIFCKDIIENITKDCPGGSYLVLNRKFVVTGGRPLIAIGYKYNAQKFLSLIYTEVTVSIKDRNPYLYKKPEPFDNVSIKPVACNLVMSMLFVSVNEVDSNKNTGSLF